MEDKTSHERARKLEESQAFTEHVVDELSEQVRKVFEQLHALSLRIASIEGRLVEMASSGDSPTADSEDEE